MDHHPGHDLPVHVAPNPGQVPAPQVHSERVPRRTVLLGLAVLLWGWCALPAATAPSRGSSPGPAGGPARGSYEEHVAKLRARIPRGFTVVTAEPFVVLGDDEPAQVRAHASGTVRWAVSRLKQEYFTRDPLHVIDVWLFKDRESYERHTRALFRETPPTPYGYYSREHHALIMNIATGGGTLVHEIVHPFVEANFPGCPPWLNEGLGSLYEQCDERNGRIWGLTNWRLPIVQEAIRRHRTLPLARLMALDADAFYEDDRGVHYAESRYLCYYLQEKGLLRLFYQQFLAHRRDDPSGKATLQEVLGERDLTAFQERWEAWVLDLTWR